jgi:hypothetical protein
VTSEVAAPEPLDLGDGDYEVGTPDLACYGFGDACGCGSAR